MYFIVRILFLALSLFLNTGFNMGLDIPPPLRVSEQDGVPNIIPVFHLEVSNGTLTNMGGGRVRLATGAGGGGGQDPITFPLIVGSGGTGLDTLTNRGILVGSGINAVQVLSALNSGELLVGSSTVIAPQILGAGLQGQVLASNSSLRLGMAWINSASIPGAAGVLYAQTENTYVVIGLNTNLTAERNLEAGRGLGLADSGANAAITLYLSTPVSVSSGGTGATTFTNRGLLIGSGASAIESLSALNSGGLIVGSSTLVAPRILTVAAGSQGYMLTTNSSTATGLAWAATSGAGGGGGTQTISIPMSLLSVEVNSGNAYWTAQTDGVRMDKAYVNMTDSGRSISTWWCYVPRNVNATPAWALDIYSEAATLAATGGFLVLNVDGMSVAVGESSNTVAASTTQLVSAGSFQLNTAGILSISTMTATNFDAALATSATDYMKVKIARQGNTDTFNADWYIYSVLLRTTVDT